MLIPGTLIVPILGAVIEGLVERTEMMGKPSYVRIQRRGLLSVHNLNSVWRIFDLEVSCGLGISVPPKQGPRRVGQLIYVKPECLEEYIKVHNPAWPEVLEQIKESNIIDCKDPHNHHIGHLLYHQTPFMCSISFALDPAFSPLSSMLAVTGMLIWHVWQRTQRCKSGGK